MRIRSFLSLLLIGISLVGCRPARRDDDAAPAAVIGVTISDLSGVNELIASDVRFTSDVLDQVFVQLLSEQGDFADHPPTFQPELAKSYEWSADRRLLTFHLRDDIRWSDGVAITAEDVRFTWQAQVSPAVAWSYAHLKDAITDVEVVDPLTVRFHFSESYTYSLVDANEGKILPRHLWSQIPFERWRESADWFRDHLVASGPFRLADWRNGREIVLERNDSFFDRELPVLDQVTFRVVPDAATHADLLASGAIDFACGLTPTDAKRLEREPGVRLVPFAFRQYEFIAWNTRKKPFDDPEIRRALTLAIDRQALVDALLAGFAEVASSPVPSLFWAHDRSLEPLPFDPQSARVILARKGFADRDGDGIVERDGKPFSFELTTNSSNRTRSDAMVLIQAQLRAIGVAVQARTMEIHTLTERNIAHEFDATIAGWAVDTTLDLKPYLHSSEADGGYNYGSYSNNEVDRLIDATRRAESPAASLPDFLRLQQLVHADQPYTFLWEPKRICATRTTLRNVRPNAISAYFNLAEWSLASSAAGAH